MVHFKIAVAGLVCFDLREIVCGDKKVNSYTGEKKIAGHFLHANYMSSYNTCTGSTGCLNYSLRPSSAYFETTSNPEIATSSSML